MMRLVERLAARRRDRVIERMIAVPPMLLPDDVMVTRVPEGVALSGRGLRWRIWGRRGRPGDPRLAGLAVAFREGNGR